MSIGYEAQLHSAPLSAKPFNPPGTVFEIVLPQHSAELVLCLPAARAIGIVVPQSLLTQADEVIE